MNESTFSTDLGLGALRERVTIVIPTLNEREAIGMLIDEVRSAGYGKILVVDGYSVDGTAEIASLKGAQVVEQHGKGKTGAILVARDIVDTPYFLLMDGDHSYDPKDIDRFVTHSEGYDHIIGFRSKGNPNISRTHRLGNWILTKTFNILMGSNIPDVACGMYLMRTQKMKQLLIDRQGFEVDQEIAAQMLVDGRVTCVPINYRKRLGAAKAPTWRQGFRALFAIVGQARRYNPVVLFGLVAAIALVPAIVLLFYAAYLYLFLASYHAGYFLGSLMLFVIGGQGLTVATIGFMLRRMEKKLTGRIEAM
ncbi:MAG TPA: glycosyltransferase family 2 protein [Candidatus Bathyarchaeia archaeon]|nr:glycosyltransferase family 2 protein [Candidatus Bathyarchaeia archaeon]